MDRKQISCNPEVRRPPAALSCGLALGALLVPAFAFAQSTLPPPATTQEEDQALQSNEEGVNTPLDESFGPKSHADWVRETRRKALDDTKIFVQVRSYYLDRDKYDDSESEAWAGGGSIGLKTGYFRERFALAATGYTSQPLHAPEDKDGTPTGGFNRDGRAASRQRRDRSHRHRSGARNRRCRA